MHIVIYMDYGNAKKYERGTTFQSRIQMKAGLIYV